MGVTITIYRRKNRGFSQGEQHPEVPWLRAMWSKLKPEVYPMQIALCTRMYHSRDAQFRILLDRLAVITQAM